MNLKQTSDKLFEDSKKTPIRGLTAIAEAEKYLQQAYEGRYLFELIQNVRDANKEKNEDGEIFIELKNNVLTISNSGAEFSPKGIEGITTIGRSTKHSQDYIGFKGIGFKSIQEITEKPRIVTKYGSILFDRSKTYNDYKNDDSIEEEEIPLFFFPHFADQKLSEEEIDKGISTKIELPLKDDVSITKITSKFSEIEAKQLILLGNIKTLEFESEKLKSVFSITKTPAKNHIEVRENDDVKGFKYYFPSNKIEIPIDVVNSLEGKEKEIFKDNAFAEVNIVLELGDNGQIQPVDNAKLYLFYPLQITSGFRFIIHSYFIVNPERTALRSSKLNDFLLKSIGGFISDEMLSNLKKTNINTNKVLCFERNSDARINPLYDSVVEGLRDKKFIYDKQTKKYYLASEVIIADQFDKGLFPDGKLGKKTLVYADDKNVIEWLRVEFNVPYLEYNDIANEIENECKRQLKLKNVKFFQNLYNYVSQHDELNLLGKKVLITDNWKLVSSEEDVFYGGKGKGNQKPVKLVKSVQKQIYFIHKDIIIKDFREGKSRTGITEFNTYEFVRRVMKLFGKSSVPKEDLLNTLFNIHELDAKSVLEIREKVLLPIQNSAKWLSPITNPIYLENENLRQLYPSGTFIDISILKKESETENGITPYEFFKQFGAWEIPAVYVAKKHQVVGDSENRDITIQKFSYVSSRPFFIQNDRLLDIPEKYTVWFTSAITENWNHYESFIKDEILPKLQYSSYSSGWKPVHKDNWVNICHFVEKLSTENWISLPGEDKNYSVREIIGINPYDFNQSQNRVIGKYVKLLPMEFSVQKTMVNALGLVHLNSNSLETFKKLLDHIFQRYKTSIPEEKEFMDFYNRILGKLVEFYETYSISEYEFKQLSAVHFLSINENTKIPRWETANKVFYIDDKHAYDLLPRGIKADLQPHFTNRDKNTVGKITGRIGIKFSKAIEKELIETPTLSIGTLVSYFNYLPETIALLESHFGDSVTKHFDTVKSIRVFEKEKVEVRIIVAESSEATMSPGHFVDVENDFDLHLLQTKAPFDSHKQMAESMNELFIHILDRDLRNFNAILLNFLNAQDKALYLTNYDITIERIQEINANLNNYTISPVQKFWKAILSANQIVDIEQSFLTDTIDYQSLAQLIEVDMNYITEFSKDFNYEKTSDSLNIDILNDLLNSLDLTLEQLNNNIFPKIDFRNYYHSKLIKLKNGFRQNFNGLLHSHLKLAASDQKSNYQNYLDHYDSITSFEIPLHTIKLNIESFFVSNLSTRFPFVELKIDSLSKNYNSFNPISIYMESHAFLIKEIAHISYRQEDFDNFLSNNKIRSLLYFNDYESVAKQFIGWLGTIKTDDTSTSETELEDFLSEFTNPTGTDIEDIDTVKAEITFSSGGTAGGGGKRFDGGANNQFKKNIGMVAEMLVFEKLNSKFENVIWVSKYASKIFSSHSGYNPEGQDGLGYDIEYFDDDGNKYFVEVKGKADDYNYFDITKNEIEKANIEGSSYKIILVTNTMDNQQRRIRNLGNIFVFEQGENFFSNNKFHAIYKDFEIRFNENKQEHKPVM
jgi:hypothetical protein